jgi:hypothetical protein
VSRPRVTIEVERSDGALVVRWTDGRASGTGRFDHLPGTSPEWLGSADELLGGADRRIEPLIIEAVAAWATEHDAELGIWHDDAGVELLR